MPRVVRRAAPQNPDRSLEGFIEVKVDSVRVSQGSAVVYLKLLDDSGLVVPVHIGEAESNALLREINRQRQARPLTHDVAKTMLQAVGCRVTKICVTDIIANTYYARIHLSRGGGGGTAGGAGSGTSGSGTSASGSGAGASEGSSGTGGAGSSGGAGADAGSGAGEPLEEVDVDARPSDAINLAIRFGAPMYVAKRIAEAAGAPPLEPFAGAGPGAAAAGAMGGAGGGGSGSGAGRGETNADIVRSVREALASYDDPTVMYQLQKELAIKEERFEDARTLHDHIVHEMTSNQLLRMVVAMESALADGRYEEAARLRDEYRRALAEGAAAAAAGAAAAASGSSGSGSGSAGGPQLQGQSQRAGGGGAGGGGGASPGGGGASSADGR